jgi:hypothetical protein
MTKDWARWIGKEGFGQMELPVVYKSMLRGFHSDFVIPEGNLRNTLQGITIAITPQ